MVFAEHVVAAKKLLDIERTKKVTFCDLLVRVVVVVVAATIAVAAMAAAVAAAPETEVVVPTEHVFVPTATAMGIKGEAQIFSFGLSFPAG